MVLDGVVIGDAARIGPGNELRHGLRVWPGVRAERHGGPVLHRRLTGLTVAPGTVGP